MRIIDLVATCRPSVLMKNHLRHQGDVSEGDKPKPIGTRTILGRKVRFYASGEHIVDADIDAEDMYESEILRFAHASLICGIPVGDKQTTWVDASVDPCDVWMFGHRVADMIKGATKRVQNGTLDLSLVVDGNPIRKIKETTLCPKCPTSPKTN